MTVFIDTSAFYASLNAGDVHHHKAREALERLREAETTLATTNYVLLECASLLQRRKSFSAARDFLSEASAVFQIIWVDERLHRTAISIWSKIQSRDLSLVDCTSFAAMRHAGIRQAAAFDAHFKENGFEVIP